MLAIEKKSMAQAAADLSYTPSALSHMADSVEAELGVKIISRTPAGIEPTEEGELILEKMRAILTAEDELFALAAEMNGRDEFELKIGAYASMLYTIVPDIIHRFKEAHPEIKVSISVGHNLTNLIKNGNADVIFSDSKTSMGLEFIAAVNDDFVVVASEKMLLCKDKITREELYSYPFILSSSHSVLRKYLDLSKFPDIVRFASVDDAAILAMVKEGVGISVLPRLVAESDPRGIKILELEPTLSRTIGFAYNDKKGMEQSYAAKKFIDFIKELDLQKNKN